MTVASDLAHEDRATALRALRDLLAGTLLDAEPGQRAALAKQLRDTLAELASLPDGKTRSASDDLAARRTARRAATPPAAPARKRGVKQRPGSG